MNPRGVNVVESKIKTQSQPLITVKAKQSRQSGNMDVAANN